MLEFTNKWVKINFAWSKALAFFRKRRWLIVVVNIARRKIFPPKMKPLSPHTDYNVWHLKSCISNCLRPPTRQQSKRDIMIIARASVASEKNTNLAMHLGAIAQWISRLNAWVRPIINAMLCGLVSEVHSAFLRRIFLWIFLWFSWSR